MAKGGEMRIVLLRALCLAVLVLILCFPKPILGQSQSDKKENNDTRAGGSVQDFHSAHFLVHSDLSSKEAEDLLKRLEKMLPLVSGYWGRSPVGTLECWVIKDLSKWPTEMVNEIEPTALAKIKDKSGRCMSKTVRYGTQTINKAKIYACVTRDGIPLHEAVHGYCWQAFGRYGPQWYREGMAELGGYWVDGGQGVNAFPYVIKYLRSQKMKTVDSLLVDDPSGEGTWQDYAWWWSLAHFLEHNQNYYGRFRALGLDLLLGKKTDFKDVFGPQMQELEFEYSFFLEHLEKGFREDLCGWDWKRKFFAVKGPELVAASDIHAGRGWQPSGATLVKGTSYEYKTTGTWQAGKGSKPVSADGDAKGRGRLEGVIMKDFKLCKPFDLSANGDFQSPADGNLYLRCKSPWVKISEDSGKIKVRIKLKK
jgi:hypothetical protein